MVQSVWSEMEYKFIIRCVCYYVLCVIITVFRGSSILICVWKELIVTEVKAVEARKTNKLNKKDERKNENHLNLIIIQDVNSINVYGRYFYSGN